MVWVVACVIGGVEHQRADRVVAGQVTSDFLGEQIWGLSAQYSGRAVLVGLEFVEGGLDLSALCVGASQLGCGASSWSGRAGTGWWGRGRFQSCS